MAGDGALAVPGIFLILGVSVAFCNAATDSDDVQKINDILAAGFGGGGQAGPINSVNGDIEDESQHRNHRYSRQASDTTRSSETCDAAIAGTTKKCMQQLTPATPWLHEASVTNLWPTNFYSLGDVVHLDSHGDDAAQLLMSLAYEIEDFARDITPSDCLTGASSCNCPTCSWYTLGGWRTVLDQQSQASVISKLASPLTAAFEAAVLGSPGGQHGDGHVQVTNIQLHVDPHGVSHRPHIDVSSGAATAGFVRSLSVIFCIAVGDSNMDGNFLRFSDPRPQASPLELTGWLVGTSVFEWEMKQGHVLFFSPHLRRHILANADEQPRIFISADIAVRDAVAVGIHIASPIVSNTDTAWWSTPVFHAQDADLFERNDALRSAILAMEAEELSVTKSNKGGWQSTANLFQRHSPSVLADLKKHTFHAVKKYLMEIEDRDVITSFGGCTVLIDIQLAWANVNRRGHSNAPHTHPASTVSGVYYIGNGADNRSSLHFIDPRMSVVNHDVPVLTTPDTEPSEIYSIKTLPGTFVLFPSWLEHFVDPHNGPDPRISISFNAIVKRLKESPLNKPGHFGEGLDGSGMCEYYAANADD